MHFNSRQAFTLIELLVVISIISLLIALLLPALKSARVAAQKTSSMSGIRQITIAQHAYAVSNKDYVSPPSYDSVSTRTWTQVFVEQSYLPDIRIYWSAGRSTSAYDFANPILAREWQTPGYAINTYAVPAAQEIGLPYDEGGFTVPPIAQVVNLGRRFPAPASFVALVESYRPNAFTNDGKDGALVIQALKTGGFDVAGAMPFSYNNGVVRTYFDGHAVGSAGEDIRWEATGPRTGNYLPITTGDMRMKPPWFRAWPVVTAY